MTAALTSVKYEAPDESHIESRSNLLRWSESHVHVESCNERLLRIKGQPGGGNIDILELEIRAAQAQRPQYVALSWLWGGQEEIEVALSVAQASKYQCVWCDAICINQTTGSGGEVRAMRDVYNRVATEREQSQRSTVPLIWITDGPASMIHSAFQSARFPIEKDDRHASLLRSTYGVITMSRHRLRNLAKTLCLSVGQLSCIPILRNFSLHRLARTVASRHERTRHSRGRGMNPWTNTDLCDRHTQFHKSFSWFLKILKHPPTSLFVLVAFAFGIMAVSSYHTNRADRFQQLLLIAGVAAAMLSCLPLFHNPGQQPVLISTIALAMTIASICSCCGHWFWRTVSHSREREVERTVEKWTHEAQTMSVDPHVVKYHHVA